MPILYTDGAYSIKGQRGGIGFLLLNDDEDEELIRVSAPYHEQTSQRAELMAVLEGLTHCDPDSYVELRTDSEYIVKGYNGEYDLKKNTDLWEELFKVTEQLRFTATHIPRRSDEWACIVDDLAKAGKEVDDA